MSYAPPGRAALATLALFAGICMGAEDLPRVAPAGSRGVKQTLLSPPVQGWELQGHGPCGVYDASPRTDAISEEESTKLFWEGPAEGPMLRAQGAFWKVSRLAMLGAREPQGPRCEVGVRVAHQGAFGGAAGLIVEAAFGNFRDAIRTADSVTDTGNDNLGIDDVFFGHCNHCLVIGANQSMHFTCRRWNARYYDALVRVEGGGKFDLTGLDTDCSGTLLQTVGDGSTIGPNNGSFRFRHVTIDAGGRTLMLVDQQQQHWLRATFEDVHFPVGDFACEATLRGPESLLRLSRIENLPRQTRLRLEGGARCVIEGTDLPSPPGELLAEGSRGELVTVNCWLGGRFIANQSTIAR